MSEYIHIQIYLLTLFPMYPAMYPTMYLAMYPAMYLTIYPAMYPTRYPTMYVPCNVP